MMKCAILTAALLLTASVANAGHYVQQVVAAPVVAYQQAFVQPIFQPVVAQYPVISAPVVQQQAFYAQPVVQQQVIQKVQKQRLFQKQVQPVRQDIKIRQRIRVR